MKYIAKLSIILSITAGSAFSQISAPEIKNFFNTSDIQLNDVFNQGLKISEKFEIPIPSLPYLDTSKNSSESLDPYNYLPIFNRVVYEYEYTSSEFIGNKKVVVEFKGYSEKDSLTNVTITYYNKKGTKIVDYTIKISPSGLISSDSILGGSRIELPIPLFKDKQWTENSNNNRITSINAKVQTQAGTFLNCLKVYTRIGGGDAGSAERYYAPGIGLVMENVNAEDKQESIKLVSFKKL